MMGRRQGSILTTTLSVVAAFAFSSAAFASERDSTARFSGAVFTLEGSAGGTTNGLDFLHLDVYDGTFKTNQKPFDAQLFAVTAWTLNGCDPTADGTYTLTRTDWYGSWRSWIDAPGPVIDMKTYRGSIDASIDLHGFDTAYTGIVSDPEVEGWCSTVNGTERAPIPSAETKTLTVVGSWEPLPEPSKRGNRPTAPKRVPADYSDLQFLFDQTPVDIGGGETNAESGKLSGTIAWPETLVVPLNVRWDAGSPKEE